MKPTFNVFLAALALIVCIMPVTCRASQFIFGADKPIIDGNINASAVKPGDTIYLSASTRLYLLLRRLHGKIETERNLNVNTGRHIDERYHKISADGSICRKLSGLHL